MAEPAPPHHTISAHLLEHAAALGVQLRPLHKNFGLEVRGMNLTNDLDKEQQQLLLDAWCQHDLLLFRGQPLTPRDEERLLLYFPHDAKAIQQGRFCNGFFKPRIPDHPLLALRGGFVGDVPFEEHFGIPKDELQTLRFKETVFSHCRLWHMDRSDTVSPPQVSAMYMVLAPEVGGETEFASAVTGFENLDMQTRRRVMRLDTIVQYGIEDYAKLSVRPDGLRRTDDIDDTCDAELAKQKGVPPPAPVPFIIQDPATGRHSFLISVLRFHHFRDTDTGADLSREESLDLLERILKAATAESERFTLKWRPNDFAVWANRRIIHTGTPDAVYHTKASRLLHMVFLDADTHVVAAREADEAAAALEGGR